MKKDEAAANESLRVSELALKDAVAAASAGASTDYEVAALRDRVLGARIGALQARMQWHAALLGLRLVVGLGPL